MGTTNRPRIQIKKNIFDWTLELITLLIFLLVLAVPIIYYNELPETVPRHFNAAGEPDAYGSKTILWILPLICSLMYVGLTILNRYPHIFNYLDEITEENAERQYRMATKLIRILKLIVTATFCYILFQTVQTALDHQQGLGTYFLPIFIVVMIAIIIGYLVISQKTKPK